MTEPCVFIQPKNSLERDKHKGEVIGKLVTRITNFPEFRKYKIDLEMLTMVCLLVEHLVKPTKDKKKKLDKKEIVIKAYELAFGTLTPADLEYLGKNIEYLVDNDKITKIDMFTRITSYMGDWFRRKVIA